MEGRVTHSSRKGAFPVAALLRSDLVGRAVKEFDETVVVTPVPDPQSLRRLVGGLSTGIMLIDPLAMLDHRGLMTWLSEGQPGWLAALYYTADPARARALMSASCESPLPLILSGCYAVTPLAGEELVRQLLAVAPSVKLIPFLSSRLVATPALLATHVLAVFSSPCGATILKELAGASGLTEGTVSRQLHVAGIRWPHQMFSSSRVLRAWDEIARGTRSFGQVARTYGFGTVRTLRRQWKAVMGTDLEKARGVPLSDAIVSTIAERLLAKVVPD
jgi:hypothetical protein